MAEQECILPPPPPVNLAPAPSAHRLSPSQGTEAHHGPEVNASSKADTPESNLLFDHASELLVPPAAPAVESVRIVPVILAQLIGENEAMFVQQVQYWIQRLRNKEHHWGGHYWVYNTHSSWQEQFPWLSESTIKRTISSLENPVEGRAGYGGRNTIARGPLLISAKRQRQRWNHTKWYRIDYVELDRIIRAHHSRAEQGEPSSDEPVRLASPRSGQFDQAGDVGSERSYTKSTCTKKTREYGSSRIGESISSNVTRRGCDHSRTGGRSRSRATGSDGTLDEPAERLLAAWRWWYRGRRRSEGKPLGSTGEEHTTDPKFGAKETLWYRCFCRLLEAGHTEETICAALQRSMGLEYPYDWPNATANQFSKLIDPKQKLVPWGFKDQKESPELAASEKKRKYDAATYNQKIEEQVARMAGLEDSLDWI